MGNLGWDIYCFVFILRFFLPKGNVRPLRQRIFLQGRWQGLKRCAIEGGKVHSAARQKVSGKRFFREAAGRMV